MPRVSALFWYFVTSNTIMDRLKQFNSFVLQLRFATLREQTGHIELCTQTLLKLDNNRHGHDSKRSLGPKYGAGYREDFREGECKYRLT